MGWKDLFIEQKTDEVKKDDGKAVASTPVSQAPVNTFQSPVISMPIVSAPAVGTPDEKFINYFNDCLAEADLPGPDYLEFKKTLISTAPTATGVVEPVLWNMVYTILKGQGLTKEVLVSSTGKYLEFLATKHQEALQQFVKAREKKVKTREDEYQKLVETIEADNQEILRLTKKIQESQARQGELKGEISIESAKIDQEEKNYEASYNVVVNSLTEDSLKINTHIN